MAAMRLNIPTVLYLQGPMEARTVSTFDLIDAMIKSADSSVSDEEVEKIERSACPLCWEAVRHVYGQPMNCLNEAMDWLCNSGNGKTIVATMPTVLLYFKMQPN